MDYTNVGGIAGLLSLAMVVIEKIYQIVNHKRIRSNCCGTKTEISLDVENTTPPSEKPLLNPGLISFNERGELVKYDPKLGKKVPYNIPIVPPNLKVLG